MKSPARKHFEQVTAAKAAGAATPGEQQQGEQYVAASPSHQKD